MSRYRASDMDLAYGEPPRSERWDASRFSRESQNRQAPVIEQRPPYESARRGGPAYQEEDRYYYDQRESGPRGTRERRFFEEDDYYDPRSNAGAMIPFRPERPSRPAGPPRPSMIRRQSSVDRFDFDRRQARRQYDDRYDRYEDYRPPPPPPREARTSHYDIKIYDDVKVQDPDTYGDDGFREYREREWVRSRTRNDDPSPDRRAPSRAGTASEFIEAAPPVAYEEKIVEEKVVEKPYPRRGKTRMPKRLVHTKVLYDLGYSYYEEDEKTLLIEKALGPDNIDEIFAKSKEYRERETVTTQLIAAPPSAVKTISEAPRSVRDWDNMARFERSPSPGSSISQSTRKSRRSRSQAASRTSRREPVHESIRKSERISRHGSSVHESIHESIHRDVHSRSPSPAPTARTGRSRRTRSRAASRRSRSSSSDTTIIERRIIESEKVEESNPVNIGMLELVPSKSRSRTDAEIQDEIVRLERERRDLRRDTEIIRYDRRRRDSSPLGVLREPSPRGEVLIADRREGEVVAVRKDKRARSKSRPPGPGLLKSMMYTIT